MSQSVIGALRANLGLDSAQFERGARRARGTANTLRRDIARIGGAVAAIGAGLAVAIRGQISAMDDIGKAADRIGVPVESLSRLQHAANLSAVSNANLEASLQRLAREMVENEQKFTDLGIAVRDADGNLRPIDAVLADLADRMQQMPQGAERTALAYELMGRQGSALIPMLEGGAAGLRAMTDEAERLGLVVTEDAYTATAQFNDNLTRLGATMRGFVRVVAGQMAPVLAQITDAAVAAFSGFQSLPDWMQRASVAIVAVTAVLGPLAGGLALVATTMGALLGPVLAVGAGIAVAAGLWAAFQSQSEPVPDRLAAVATAQATLNEALGLFSDSGAPQAGGAALNYARDLEQQAAAALAAAEAELALMQAEVARFTQRGGAAGAMAGVMDPRARREAIEAERAQIAEVDRLRETLDGARRTVDDLSQSEDILAEANRQVTVTATAVSVETGDLSETLQGIADNAGRAAGTMPDLSRGLEGVGQAADDSERRIERVGSTLGRLFMAGMRGADALRSAVANLLGNLAELLANQAFTSLLRGSGAGSGSGGFLSGLFKLLSFDGGGFTGLGARVGGLDGKGGFPALLHPNETVIDHTKGGAVGLTRVEVSLSEDLVARTVEQSAGVSVQYTNRALAQRDRNTVGMIQNSQARYD